MNLILLREVVFLCDIVYFFKANYARNPTLSPCCVYQDFEILLEPELPKVGYCPIG